MVLAGLTGLSSARAVMLQRASSGVFTHSGKVLRGISRRAQNLWSSRLGNGTLLPLHCSWESQSQAFQVQGVQKSLHLLMGGCVKSQCTELHRGRPGGLGPALQLSRHASTVPISWHSPPIPPVPQGLPRVVLPTGNHRGCLAENFPSLEKYLISILNSMFRGKKYIRMSRRTAVHFLNINWV